MPNQARENRILDAIKAQLDTIGPVGATWLTDPTVAIGAPDQESLSGLPKQRIYLHHVSTDEVDRELSTGTGAAGHGVRMVFQAWLVSSESVKETQARDLSNIKADVRRAISSSAAETLFTDPAGANVQGGLWPGDYTVHPELMKAGVLVGLQQIIADCVITHEDP